MHFYWIFHQVVLIISAHCYVNCLKYVLSRLQLHFKAAACYIPVYKIITYFICDTFKSTECHWTIAWIGSKNMQLSPSTEKCINDFWTTVHVNIKLDFLKVYFSFFLLMEDINLWQKGFNASLRCINSLPNDKFLDWSKFKEFADEKIDLTKKKKKTEILWDG